MNIVIVDNGGANMNSLVFALERLGQEPKVSCDANTITVADRIILPGVGHAGSSMNKMADVVETVKALDVPVLGICLGMQLLFDYSDEGQTFCLGVIEGDIKKLQPPAPLPCPHMGWNRLKIKQHHPVLTDIEDGTHMYFVHSYYAPVNQYAIATTEYGEEFSAIASRNNFTGVQFHPERSGKLGEKLLANFLDIS